MLEEIPLQLQVIPSNDITRLTTLLKDADEDIARVQATIEDSTNTAYAFFDNDMCVGALLMHWQSDESEILYIAIDETRRGRGYGKAAIVWIIEEAQRRGAGSVIVGTANSSVDNIAFYQKCGFRMDAVRKDYFSYLTAPVYEDGILVQDMVMFRFEIASMQ